MSTSVFYYYANLPNISSRGIYSADFGPDYDTNGLAFYDTINFGNIYGDYLDSGGLVDFFASAQRPRADQMMIIKASYTQGDVSYGTGGEFGTLGHHSGQQQSVYMPMTGGNLGEGGAEPIITFSSSPSLLSDQYTVELNGSEENGLFLKYGGLPTYINAKSVIDSFLFSATGIVTQMYTAVVTRQNIPNVILTNSQNTNILESIENEATVNASNFTISTSAASTSGY